MKRSIQRFILRGLVAASLMAAACSSQTSANGTSAESKRTGKESVARATLVIDVRTPEEFASGHVDGAVNIPVDEVEGRLNEIAEKVGGDRSKPIAVYCAAGGRAGRAKTVLDKAGFSDVTNAGGFRDIK